jgi:trimethylamine:corrinoid methyltransferase-like protein
LIDVVRGMRDMVAEARDERNDRLDNREESRRPKSVREKMGDNITDRLLLLCRASYDEELPRLYQ